MNKPAKYTIVGAFAPRFARRIAMDTLLQFEVVEFEADDYKYIKAYDLFMRKNAVKIDKKSFRLFDYLFKLGINDFKTLKAEYNSIQDKKSKLNNRNRQIVCQAYDLIKEKIK
jgi:hypothetical protein